MLRETNIPYLDVCSEDLIVKLDFKKTEKNLLLWRFSSAICVMFFFFFF